MEPHANGHGSLPEVHVNGSAHDARNGSSPNGHKDGPVAGTVPEDARDGAAVTGLEGDDAPPTGFGLASLLESLLFVADQPVRLTDLAKAMDVSRHRVETTVEELARSLRFRGVRLQRADGAVQMVSAPEAAGTIQRFLGLEASARLSPAALEALAIIAYEQPVTRPEVDDYRGVNSDGVIRTLQSRGLVEEIGRRETVGYPIEYGTTFLFLEYFGLSSTEDLPPVDEFVAAAEAAQGHGGGDAQEEEKDAPGA